MPSQVTLLGPWPPPYGGVAVHVENLASSLSRAGFDVRVIGYGRFVPSERLQVAEFSPVGWLRTLVRVWGAAPTGSLIHTHSVFTASPSRMVLASFRILVTIKRLTWIDSVHDQTLVDRVASLPSGPREAMFRALRAAHHVIVVSDALGDLVRQHGVLRERVTTITPLLPPAETEMELPAALDHFVSERPTITVVGAFDPLYDLTTVAAAFLELRQSGRDLGLIILAPSFTSDAVEESAVRAALDAVGRYARIVFDLPHSSAQRLYRKSAVVVRGPRSESFGLSRAEALMQGTPVVATDVGEAAFVTCYRYGDVTDLVRQIGTCLDEDQHVRTRRGAEYYCAMAAGNLNQILDAYARSSR